MLQVFAENRKANFNHDILEKFAAGLVLLGTEVKSIRLGHASLMGSYVFPGSQGLELVGSHIPAYQVKNAPSGYLPERSRRLLLTKKEIDYLKGRLSQERLTLLPLKLYTVGSQIKLEFGLAKTLKKYDKKEKIKKRETDREIKRALG